MPGGNRTGPAGMGPRTGRGLGYCNGYDTPGFINAPGMGLGRGWGGGMGYGRGLAWRRGRGGGGGWGRGGGLYAPQYAPYAGNAPIYNPLAPGIPNMSPENQLNMLKQDKEYLEAEVKGISNTLDEISKKISDLEKKE